MPLMLKDVVAAVGIRAGDEDAERGAAVCEGE